MAAVFSPLRRIAFPRTPRGEYILYTVVGTGVTTNGGSIGECDYIARRVPRVQLLFLLPRSSFSVHGALKSAGRRRPV